jgi:hypothetical protein
MAATRHGARGTGHGARGAETDGGKRRDALTTSNTVIDSTTEIGRHPRAQDALGLVTMRTKPINAKLSILEAGNTALGYLNGSPYTKC